MLLGAGGFAPVAEQELVEWFFPICDHFRQGAGEGGQFHVMHPAGQQGCGRIIQQGEGRGSRFLFLGLTDHGEFRQRQRSRSHAGITHEIDRGNIKRYGGRVNVKVFHAGREPRGGPGSVLIASIILERAHPYPFPF